MRVESENTWNLRAQKKNRPSWSLARVCGKWELKRRRLKRGLQGPKLCSEGKVVSVNHVSSKLRRPTLPGGGEGKLVSVENDDPI